MPQSLAKNFIHLIFSTKKREPLLPDSIRGPFHGYLAGIFQDLASPALKINSVSDHVHILFNLNKSQALAQVVEFLRRYGIEYDEKFVWD
ncbi:MAG: transposase [Lentisphaeria bacterium]